MGPDRIRRMMFVSLLVVQVAACSAGRQDDNASTPGAQNTVPNVSAAIDRSVTIGSDATRIDSTGGVPAESDSTYEFTRLTIGAGGFVTGMAFAGEERYIRTDVGGAYRWDDDSSSWVQMLTTRPSTLTPGPVVSSDYSVEAIAVAPTDPRVVVLSAGSDGNPDEGDEWIGTGRVLVSIDGGSTFRTGEQRFFINGNQSARTMGERLAIDPDDSSRVLLGTRREGLWTSSDMGLTWRQLASDVLPFGAPETNGEHAGITFVAFDPDRSGRVYAGVAGDGVYRSDDRGSTWTRIMDVSEGVWPQHPTFAGPSLIVGFTDNPGEGRSSLQVYDPTSDEWRDITPSEDGNSWAATAQPANASIMIAAADAVRDGHLFFTRDGGASWKTLEVSVSSPEIPWLENTDLEGWMSIGALQFDPVVPGRVWFAEGMGMWRTDLGEHGDPETVRWVSDSVGIEETVATDLTVNGAGLPVPLVADRQGFLIVDPDAYPTATLIDPRFISGADIAVVAADRDQMVWIGAATNVYYSSDREARGATSDDGGATWRELPNLEQAMYGGNVAVSATSLDNIVWLPTYGGHPFEYQDEPRGLYMTNDRGANWTHLADVGGSNTFHRLFWWVERQALAADAVDGGVFYLVDQDASMYVSDDGGSSWEKAAYGPPCEETNACHVFGQVRAVPGRAGVLVASVGTDGLYSTDDRGRSEWIKMAGIDEAHAFDFGAPLTAGGPPTIFVWGRGSGDPDFGLWSSGDWGATWNLLTRAPYSLANAVTVVSGDPQRPGVVYIGFGGSGFVIGTPGSS